MIRLHWWRKIANNIRASNQAEVRVSSLSHNRPVSGAKEGIDKKYFGEKYQIWLCIKKDKITDIKMGFDKYIHSYHKISKQKSLQFYEVVYSTYVVKLINN